MKTYQNPAVPTEERVDDLLSRMELDEKIAQMHAVWLFLDENGEHGIRSDRFPGKSDAESVNAMLLNGLGQVTRPLGTRAVNPRRAARASFALPVDMLNFTGYHGYRMVEPGEFELMVGASSSNIRLRTVVQVSGAVRKLPRQWRMESEFSATLN